MHAGGSATGRHVTAALSSIVDAHERIEVRERSSALGLWVRDGRCIGALTDKMIATVFGEPNKIKEAWRGSVCYGNNAAWYVYSFTLLALKRVRPCLAAVAAIQPLVFLNLPFEDSLAFSGWLGTRAENYLRGIS